MRQRTKFCGSGQILLLITDLKHAWKLTAPLCLHTPNGLVDCAEGDVLAVCDTTQGKQQMLILEPPYFGS